MELFQHCQDNQLVHSSLEIKEIDYLDKLMDSFE